MLASVDQTEELKDYVLTAMRQLSRMSSGLAMLLPTSSLHQGSHSSLDDTTPRGADLMGRVWHSLHKVSAAVNSLARHSTAGLDPYFDALDLTLLPPDPTMALEAIHAKLLSLRHKLETPLAKMDAAARPLLMSAWEQGHADAHEHTATAVACWTSRAAELHSRVEAAMATTTGADTSSPVLAEVLQFLGSMHLIHTPAAVTASAARQVQAVDGLVTALQSALPPPSSHESSFHAPGEDGGGRVMTDQVPPQHPHARRLPPQSTRPKQPPEASSPHQPFIDVHKKRPSKDYPKPHLPLEKKVRRPSTSPYATVRHNEDDAMPPHEVALPPTDVSPASSRRSRLITLDLPVPSTPPPVQSVDEKLVASPVVPHSRVVGCEKCFMNNNHDKMLLCDNNCGREYHMYCLQPQLDVVPEDDWFCPECVKVACLAMRCSRFCVFNQKYCPRHLCKFQGCPFRCKKQGYCGKHSKLHAHEGGGSARGSTRPLHPEDDGTSAGPPDPYVDDDDNDKLLKYK
ncbi:hypothetical protein, variant [Aphanomyces astaci]|nr:hypothetical protein, variant [Aphanomyces astaci]ETV80661.1 hypothetical protein, variant [Aphanomyces astaci]|eukprot:XP_009829608.1 hypothetical protein, variant [Aphanomyces astaci]